MEDTCPLRVLQRFVSMDNGHMVVDQVGSPVTALPFVGNS